MSVRNQEPITDAMIGRIILDFRVVEKLAEGGMGAVYLARHQYLADRRKVIKILLPQYAQNAMIRQRFEREAVAVSKLEHDRIVGIDGFGMLDDGQLFLMIEYLDGQPLDAYLRSRGRLAEHRALHIVIQLCDALDFAHTKGIVHRDLKPQNVFVVRTNQNWAAIKLLDFGIAKVIGDKEVGPATHSGIAIGTPSYMAVEQYEHADKATHLADVYSLAVMIWEMVTGELPWRHHDQAVLYFQQRTMIPERPPETVMSKAWCDILLAALSVEPAQRPQSVRELAIILASKVPAIGRVPSGAEMLSNLAPHFVQQASPTDATVRNAAEIDRLGPLLWPTHETGPGAPQALPPLNVTTSPAGRAGTPIVAATVNERPSPAAPGASARPTTLSASTGSTSAPSERTVARWKLVLVAGGACAFAALATGLIASRASNGGEPVAPSAASAPSEPPAVTPPDAAIVAPTSKPIAIPPVPSGVDPAPRGEKVHVTRPEETTERAAAKAAPSRREEAAKGVRPSRAKPSASKAKARGERSPTTERAGPGSARPVGENPARGSAQDPPGDTFDPNAVGGGG